MPITYGNTRTTKLTLQGNGTEGDNYSMHVADDKLKISAGTENVCEISKTSAHFKSINAVKMTGNIEAPVATIENIKGGSKMRSNLSGNTYCLPLINVAGNMIYIGPVAAYFTITFEYDTVSFDDGVYQFGWNYFDNSVEYQIIEEPEREGSTTMISKVYLFFENENVGDFDGTFMKLTFSNDLTKITNFEAGNKGVKEVVDQVKAIVSAVDEDNFKDTLTLKLSEADYSKFDGNVEDLHLVYMTDTAKWKENVAISLLTTHESVISSLEEDDTFIQPSKVDFARMMYNNDIVQGVKAIGNEYYGRKIENKRVSPNISSKDIYKTPMDLEHSVKRLSGTSRNSFEPTRSTKTITINGVDVVKNVDEEEIDEDTNTIKHINIRGLDVISYHNRIEVDPSQPKYVVGRSIIHLRYKKSLLEDTYFYPNGPEFRINLLMPVKKLVFNDTEIPAHLIKRKHWDEEEKDGSAVCFNFEEASVVPNYITEGTDEHTYVEGNLNKVEIWYEGIMTQRNNSSLMAQQGVSDSNPLSSIYPNLTAEQKKYFDKYNIEYTTYGFRTIEEETFSLNTRTYGPYMLSSVLSDTCLEFYPDDNSKYLYRIFPVNSAPYDKSYFQLEILVPEQYIAHSGGHRLAVAEINNKKLFKFVPGYKSSSTDYRSSIATAMSFTVDKIPERNETLTLASGNVVEMIDEIPVEFLSWYDQTNFVKHRKDMLDVLEELLGPYPYDTCGTAISRQGGSAMEHMERAAYSMAFREIYVYVHEIVHMWWQNKVTFGSRKDYWIDEGITSVLQYYALDVLAARGVVGLDSISSARSYKSHLGITEDGLTFKFPSDSVHDLYGSQSYDRVSLLWYLLMVHWGTPLGKPMEDGNLDYNFPSGPQETYYDATNVNTHFWDAIKYFLGEYNDASYNYKDVYEVLGEFAANNSTNWGNQWPNTAEHVKHFFEEMTKLKVGDDKLAPLSKIYKLSIKQDLLGSFSASNTLQEYTTNGILPEKPGIYYRYNQIFTLIDGSDWPWDSDWATGTGPKPSVGDIVNIGTMNVIDTSFGGIKNWMTTYYIYPAYVYTRGKPPSFAYPWLYEGSDLAAEWVVGNYVSREMMEKLQFEPGGVLENQYHRIKPVTPFTWNANKFVRDQFVAADPDFNLSSVTTGSRLFVEQLTNLAWGGEIPYDGGNWLSRFNSIIDDGSIADDVPSGYVHIGMGGTDYTAA